MVLGVKEPIPRSIHDSAFVNGQVLFTYLHLAASRPCTDALLEARQRGHRL